MSGLHEVACDGCGRRFETSDEQASTHRVLRCACGQFVRFDPSSLEPRAGSLPPQAAELADANDAEQNGQTQMLGARAEFALADPEQRRSPEPSLLDAQRPARPVPQRSSHSLTPAPEHVPSTAPADKPHWHVDLGGSETVRMTIEQLIVARRSGKLGEGALVWRKGLPSWRPVGSLIPAVSRPTPTPPAPSRTPPPRVPGPTPPPARSPSAMSLPPEDAAHSIVSYERPVATLEFALEKSEEPTRSPLPSQERSPRAATPLPSQERSPLRSLRAATPLPSSLLRSPRTATPLPRAPTRSAAALAPVRVATATPLPALPPPAAPPVQRASSAPAPRTPPDTAKPIRRTIESTALDWLGDRPRWLSACIALFVCFTASGSGAFLVRSLKQRKQPLALTSSAATQAKRSARAAGSGAELGAPAAPRPPMVVDLESLSIEHSPARPAARPVAKLPAAQLAAGPNGESADATSDQSSLALPTAQRPKTSDLPEAARANPYTTGSTDEALRQKRATPGGDESGF
jgi:hypothetical protein